MMEIPTRSHELQQVLVRSENRYCMMMPMLLTRDASNRFSFKKKTGLSRPACLRSVIRLEPVCGLSVALVGPARFLEVV